MHETCERHGCERPVNRDGVCLPHKLKSVHFGGLERLRRNRESDVTQAEIKRNIYKHAREDGRDIRRVGTTSPSSGPLM